MTLPLRLITRIGLFSALYYVLSLAFAAVPNVNPGFFVVFSAGFLWGPTPGLLVGAIGMGAWTIFNPFGPALPPISAAQIVGMSLVGLFGWLFSLGSWKQWSLPVRILLLAIAGMVSAILFFLPVNIMDAVMFQPFWPRFIAGALMAQLALYSNAIAFPILFVVIARLYDRESSLR